MAPPWTPQTVVAANEARTASWGRTDVPNQDRVAEIRGDELTKLIELSGTRLLWTRAAVCPCTPVNTQTRQPDPLCPLCKSAGVYYFGPPGYTVPDTAGVLTPLQSTLQAQSGGTIIRGLIQRVTQQQDAYDRLGNWLWGTLALTTRAENRIGYYDRFVAIDAEITYSEILTVGAGGVLPALRYPATYVNALRSVDTVFQAGVDFSWNQTTGQLVWLGTALAKDTRLSAHYACFPTWLLVEHPHAVRASQQRMGTQPLVSPLGSPLNLPIQGAVKLEFLTDAALSQ